MKSSNSNNIIREWYKLAEPNKLVLTSQILSYVIYVVFYTLTTYFAALTINSLYESNWKMAYIYLGIELLTIFFRNLFLHLEFNCYAKSHLDIRSNVAKKIYHKILACEGSKLKKISQDKIISILCNNMEYVAEFADTISIFIARLVQFALVFFVIATSNIYAGLIIIVIGIINYFAMKFLNKKLGRSMNERHIAKDSVLETYDKVVEGKSLINELSANEIYEEEVLNSVENYAKAYANYYKTYSYRENIYFICWNVFIYLTTALMIYFVSNGSLGMEAYLIIVPNLTVGITKLNQVYNNAENFEKMKVDVKRINLILSLNDRELSQYGQINCDTPGYNLGFIDVSYKNDDSNSEYAGMISHIDLSFMMNKINVVKGKKGCGKRHIFNILRRYIKPDQGIVLLDNLDLFKYDLKNFKTHINYCSSHPVFIKGTIRENLLIVNNDFEKVEDVCKKVGVYDTILKLPQKFDTDISSSIESSTLFLIGLARAVLSNCKILMVYELPDDVSKSFRKNIKNLFKTNNFNKTIIIFTHCSFYDDIADMKFLIENGKVKSYQTK